MKRILHQAEGGTTEGLQGFVERHGTKASVRRGKRETEQVDSRRIGRRLTCQLIPAAAQKVLNGSADGFHPRG